MKSHIGFKFHMDEKIAAFYQELNAYMQNNLRHIKKDAKEYKRRAAEDHLIYAGRPFAIGFYPVILSKSQYLHIASTVEALLRLMEKATQLFLDEPAIRKLFGFDRNQIDLIKVDPGYKRAIPCARFDSFFDGETVRFTEINTDGAAGMDGAEKVTKYFLASSTMQEVFAEQKTTTFAISHRVLQTLLECYKEFKRGKATRTPVIAVVDWKETRTCAEFEAFVEFCKGEGYDAVVADPRELEYDGKALSHGGTKIDIIYRRVVSREYIERLDEVKPMTQAFKDHNVCLVGSFRSDVAFSKKIFALIHDPKYKRFFTEKERKLTLRHVPWTRAFEDTSRKYHGEKAHLPYLARKAQNDFVLKPANLYEGRGVELGVKRSRAQWDKIIKSSLDNDYVLQELIPMPSMQVGLWKDNFKIEKRYIHLGEYVFGGKFCGFYCRAARGPIINRLSKEVVLPCFVLEK